MLCAGGPARLRATGSGVGGIVRGAATLVVRWLVWREEDEVSHQRDSSWLLVAQGLPG
jgi:hypothetical protein